MLNLDVGLSRCILVTDMLNFVCANKSTTLNVICASAPFSKEFEVLQDILMEVKTTGIVIGELKTCHTQATSKNFQSALHITTRFSSFIEHMNVCLMQKDFGCVNHG